MTVSSSLALPNVIPSICVYSFDWEQNQEAGVFVCSMSLPGHIGDAFPVNLINVKAFSACLYCQVWYCMFVDAEEK